MIPIDWDELLSAQHKLDIHTFRLKGLSYPVTRTKRLLALLVELNELANETKSFKFWVVNAEGKRDRIIEEYVDVLHFTLSISCDRKEELLGVGAMEDVKLQDSDFVSEYLLKLNVDFSKIVADMLFDEAINLDVNDKFRRWVQNFIDLSSYLGFAWHEVLDAYWKKWKVNFERQNSGKY